MKSLLFAMVTVLLVGCASSPPPVIRQKFPEPPELLMRPVPELKKLQ